MTPETLAFEPTLTAFMMVKTAPEWLALPIDRRFELLGEYITPLLRKYADSARLRFYDVEFYAAHVTDIWLWEARDHQVYQLLVEELRETPFWDRYFTIVDILVGVENAYARNYGRVPVTALS